MEKSHIVKVLSLAFHLSGNHVLLGQIMDRLVQVLPSLLDVINPRRAKRLEEREDLLAVLDALCRVDERNLSSICVIGIKNRIARPALVYRGNLVSEVVCVGNTRVETKATSRREGVRSVADSVAAVSVDRARVSLGDIQEDVAIAVLLCNFAAEKPRPVTQDIKWDVLANGCF